MIGCVSEFGAKGERRVGPDLYPTIPPFVAKALGGHDAVERVTQESIDEEIVFRVKRHRYNDEVTVWLSDAYFFTSYDFFNKPTFVKSGDFILIARPESSYSVSRADIDHAKIGVGKLAELMGALNLRNIWTYQRSDSQRIPARGTR